VAFAGTPDVVPLGKGPLVEATMNVAPTFNSQGGLRMLKKLFLLLAGSAAGAAVVLYLLTLPLLRRLPKEGRVSLDGITTIAEAIAACRHSGLRGS
jgi:hypothetical protein